MADDWNATDMVFTDISVEAERTYVFHDGEVTIRAPTHLNVSQSGGHRIRTEDNRGFYIPVGFMAIEWTAKPGHKLFVA